jgi:hypothetical protein
VETEGGSSSISPSRYVSATHYLGGTAVTAPAFFDAAARSDTLFWHPDPKHISGFPVDSPLVIALADFTDNDFEENYAPHLQRRQDWVILTPPLPNGAKKKAFLEQYGQGSDRTRQGIQRARVVDVWP